jgi:hypothetical protein
VTIGEGI